MPDLTLALPPAYRGFDPGLLTGQLAPASLVGYRRDVALYLRFCADLQTALEATSLARWRTHLAARLCPCLAGLGCVPPGRPWGRTGA